MRSIEIHDAPVCTTDLRLRPGGETIVDGDMIGSISGKRGIVQVIHLSVEEKTVEMQTSGYESKLTGSRRVSKRQENCFRHCEQLDLGTPRPPSAHAFNSNMQNTLIGSHAHMKCLPGKYIFSCFSPSMLSQNVQNSVHHPLLRTTCVLHLTCSS